ncbi:MAG: hypothetical protein GF311_00880 [Candidatus Lokiarchaeota archaeon]|nr:hypothetical protein [Candidatus Lokiarchaeota archaeon]
MDNQNANSSFPPSVSTIPSAIASRNPSLIISSSISFTGARITPISDFTIPAAKVFKIACAVNVANCSKISVAKPIPSETNEPTSCTSAVSWVDWRVTTSV